MNIKNKQKQLLELGDYVSIANLPELEDEVYSVRRNHAVMELMQKAYYKDFKNNTNRKSKFPTYISLGKYLNVDKNKMVWRSGVEEYLLNQHIKDSEIEAKAEEFLEEQKNKFKEYQALKKRKEKEEDKESIKKLHKRYSSLF